MLRAALLLAALATLAGNYQTLIRLTELPMPFPAAPAVIEPLPEELQHIAYSPPSDRFEPTRDLRQFSERLYGISGCETVAPAPDGTITLIDKWNNVHVATPVAGHKPRPVDEDGLLEGWVVTPHPLMQHLGVGRVLGAVYDTAGNLFVADAVKGLCMVNFSITPPRLEILASRLPADVAASSGIPAPIAYADDLDVHPNGTVFFSDASTIPPLSREPDGSFNVHQASVLEVCRGRPSGRLLAYHPSTGATSVLLTGLWFANGVVVAPDASYVLVCETFTLRVLRYWLAGPKAGTSDVFISALPGLPDGISRVSGGGYWVSLVVPYQPKIQGKLGWRAFRWVLAWVPRSLQPKVKGWGYVLRVREDGGVEEVLADLGADRVEGVTSAVEAGGKLWLGNLHHGHVTVVGLYP